MDFNFERPFIIAEIGGNHEGSLGYAKELVIQAAESGADAVKFQTYFPEKIVSKIEDPDRYKHFSRFSLPIENYIELAELAKENNIMFMSSIWDPESVRALDDFIDIHKVGSGDITNYPLIREIISTGKPLIISTAMSTMREVDDTVKFIESARPDYANSNKLAILQCVAMYGQPKEEYANLSVITSLLQRFPNHTVGYSDHTLGNFAANIAVALGATILEVHFTDDKSREFRDHHISLTKEELIELRKNIHKTLTLLGEGEKIPVKEVETLERISEFRRSCYLKYDCQPGDLITEENLTTLRPNKGIDSRDYFKLLDKKLLVNKKAFEAIYWEDVEDGR